MMNLSGIRRSQGDISRNEERHGQFDTCAVPMSVVEHGKRIAFAAYNNEDNTIRLEDFDQSGYDTYGMIECVVAVMRPSLLLLPNKVSSNELLLEALRTPPANPPEGSLTEDSVPAQDSIPYKLMKTSCFEIRTCKAIILTLHVDSLMGQRTGPSNNQPNRNNTSGDALSYKMSSFHSLATLIDFENTAQVMAIGSLLSFLKSSTLSCVLDSCISVQTVAHANVTPYMTVSADSFSALNIFSTEHHPLVAAKGSGNSKEGFSLFSLLDYTKSRAGRAKLREWMLKPSTQLDTILRRQDGVELFHLQEMQIAVDTIRPLLEQIGVIGKIVIRIQKSCGIYTDFLTLIKSISSAMSVVEVMQEEVLGKLNRRLLDEAADGSFSNNPDNGSTHDHRTQHYIDFTVDLLQRCRIVAMRDLSNRITQVIDEEATLECKDLVIRPGLDNRLDKLKDEYIALDETLEIARESIHLELPHLARDFSVVYMPQVGFLVAMQNHATLHEMLTDDFVVVFAEEETIYFKNEYVRQLDEEIGDLAVEIRDAETIIVAELEDEIVHCELALFETFNSLAELDCILSFASVARKNNYVRPEVLPPDEYCIQIVDGRHPVQELEVDGTFIANDTCVDASNRVNIITGPNYSGKSCYARQVGVIVFMAQIGSFVPCEAARISISNQLLAHFSSVESCSVPQSSFQLDLTKMGSILRRATPRSLVIVDEFGKGTSPASGISLLSAAIHLFSKIQCKVVCTTHFLELFSMGLIKDGTDGVKAFRMAVHIPETTEDSVVPLFTLEEGVASSSAGIACARTAGVKEAVIERAHEIVEAVKNRRKVDPLMEILRTELDLNGSAKITMTEFIETDWKSASDLDLDQFVSRTQKRFQTF